MLLCVLLNKGEGKLIKSIKGRGKERERDRKGEWRDKWRVGDRQTRVGQRERERDVWMGVGDTDVWTDRSGRQTDGHKGGWQWEIDGLTDGVGDGRMDRGVSGNQKYPLTRINSSKCFLIIILFLL